MRFNDSEFAEFREFIAEVGKDFRLVQSKGGNASIKAGNTVWVKSSGTRLFEAIDRKSWVECRRTSEGGFESLDRSAPVSIEAPLHSWFNNRYVLHLHPIGCITWSLQHGRQENFGSQGFFSIPYMRPGQNLLLALSELAVNRKLTQPAVLQNHGVLLAADSLRELINLVTWTKDTFESASGPADPGLPDTRKKFSALVQNDLSEEALAKLWRITPDHCVFLGPQPPELVGDLWYFDNRSQELNNLDDNRLSMLEAWVRTASLLTTSSGGVSTISLEEASELRGWDAEVKRLNVD